MAHWSSVSMVSANLDRTASRAVKVSARAFSFSTRLSASWLSSAFCSSSLFSMIWKTNVFQKPSSACTFSDSITNEVLKMHWWFHCIQDTKSQGTIQLLLPSKKQADQFPKQNLKLYYQPYPFKYSWKHKRVNFNLLSSCRTSQTCMLNW